MRLAIDGVERARDEAKSNLTRIYWMSVKMQNNHHKFKEEELNKATVMENALAELVQHYDDMIDLEKNILSEFSEVKQKLSKVENIGMNCLKEEMDIDGLYDKMNLCLTEGQICMSRQKKILQDANALEQSLKNRGNSGGFRSWWLNLVRKVRGVPVENDR
jgi:hypothetical protein